MSDHRLYDDLAAWWPVITPPEDRADLAERCLELLTDAVGAPLRSLLELGAGVGPMATHWPDELDVVLVDRAPGMVAVSRELNPGREHVVADLCTVELDRTFDAVLLHDAIMYLTTIEQLRAALSTARRHLRSGGALLLVPDEVRETWEPTTVMGGGERDERSARLMEWHWDPDPTDRTVQVELALLLRDADGGVISVHDRHEMALYTRDELWAELRAAGFLPVEADPWLAAQIGEAFLSRAP